MTILSPSIRTMKIIYFISSLGHGQGGSLYSLRDLVKSLDRGKIEPVIVVTGDGKATRVFDDLECGKFFLLMRRADEMGSVLRKMESIVRVERPDILHSCSNTALFSAMYLSRIYRIPLLHTQPHGLKPELFPRIPYLIAYSEEGKSFFADDPKHQDMEIFRAPNRVARIIPDRVRTEKLRKELNLPPGFVFLRIARICDMYKESFLKSIALVRKLNEDGIPANMLILGVNEQPWVCEELKQHESASVRVVTGDEYIHDADDLMEIADCVVGAGNSFMAAASLGKVLLTAPSFTRYPVLVDGQNFDTFFSFNFRCTSPCPPGFQVDDNERYAALIELLKNNGVRNEYRKFSLGLFEKYFDVGGFVKEYERICEHLEYRPMASVADYYRRFSETLRATSERVVDKISARKLKLESIKLLLSMFLSGARNAMFHSFQNNIDKTVKLAVANDLEVREFRADKERYDLVVLAQAHNEEKLVARFLSEAGAVADGIIFLDDGSTDRTNELAVHEKVILKLRKRRHEGFNDLANRNLLLAFAELIPARWFLFLDIDEIVEDRCRAELKKTVEKSGVDIIEVGIVNLWGDEDHVRVDLPPPLVNGVLWRPRMFRKKKKMRIISEKPLHFDLIPYATEKITRGRIMVRHYASVTKERRIMRYERYRREDPNHLSQSSYDHIISEKVVLKPVETAYDEIERAAAGSNQIT